MVRCGEEGGRGRDASEAIPMQYAAILQIIHDHTETPRRHEDGCISANEVQQMEYWTCKERLS